MDLLRRVYAPTVSAQRAGLGRVAKSATAPDATPEALITYPVRDLQGDVVEPGGIGWADFESTYERRVNLEHGPYVGTAEVSYKSVPRLNEKGEPDEHLGLIALPFGVTTFFQSVQDARNHSDLPKYDAAGKRVGAYTPDECFAYAEQTAPLVADGTLSGVSLEFAPDGIEGVAYKALGPHPLLKGRPAYHFFRTRALGYAAACELPVNPFAGYVRPDDEVLAKAEKALRVCERPGTLELVRKSLTPLARLLDHNPTNRVTTPVRRDPVSKTAGRTVKGMYDDDDTSADPAVNADAAADAAGTSPDQGQDDAGMKPTPAALFQFAQALRDACAMAEDMGSRGEHPQGGKALKKFCEQVEAIADKVAAMADKVAAAVDAGDEQELDEEADAEPVETDDDGMIQAKAFGRTAWRPARYTKACPYEMKHVRRAKKAGADGQVLVDAEHLKNLETLAKIALDGR